MHIPDGFLSLKVAAATGVLAAAGLAISVRNTRKRLPARRVPLMGLSAAFIFAAQMLNFPVAGGTSGHLIGGVLASVLLGPSAAILVLTAVLIVQAFVFADGGVLALGANVFNMAIVSSVGGYFVYRAVWRVLPSLRGRLTAIAFASWCATVLAAIVCAGELTFSGATTWSVSLAAMAVVHMIIGVGEAVITTLVVFAIWQVRPELLSDDNAPRVPGAYREFIAYGLLIALGLAAFVAPFACTWPDGLESVAGSLGLKPHESGLILTSPLANYHLPGVNSAAVATAIVGIVGTVIAFLLGLVLARILVPRGNRTTI